MQNEYSNYTHDFIASQFGKPVRVFNLNSSSSWPWKSKIISLRLLSCLFICGSIFGISTKAYGADNELPKKSALIVPKGANDNSHSTTGQPESFESYQIRILRNQNHLQAEKIKALREELLDITQKLHELKPHLFKQSDPADQSKIAELTHQLGEKETALTKLTALQRDMEIEVLHARKKVLEMETVKDALTDMVEKHKSAKDETSAIFQKQMEDMRLSAGSERNAMLKKIQQHELMQEKLNQTLSEKNKAITRLDTVANAQETALSAKNQELLALEAKTMKLYEEILTVTEAYTANQKVKDQQIETLMASMELEKTKNNQLQSFKDQMEWLADIFQGTQSLLQNEIANLRVELEQEKTLNAELTLVKSELDLRRQELSLLMSTHTQYKTEMDTYARSLAKSLEKEQSRAEQLQNQFQALMSDQESGKRYAESLEVLLAEMQEVLSNKHAELQAANDAHSQMVGSLLIHLDNTQSMVENHQAYRETLEKYLELVTTQQTITEKAREDHHEKIVAGHKDAYQSLQNNLLAIEDTHRAKDEQQEAKNKEIEEKLNEALAKHQDVKIQAGNLESILQEANHRAASLEGQLASHKIALEEKEKQLALLETNKVSSFQSMEKKFQSLADELNRELARSVNLEMILQDAANQLVQNEDEITHHKVALQTKQNDIQKLQDAHTEAYVQWTDQLIELQATLDEQKKHTERMKNELTADLDHHKNILASKHEQLNTLNTVHELLKTELSARIDEISQGLEAEHQRAIVLQEQLTGVLAQYENEQKRSEEHANNSRQLAGELEEKMRMLALLESKASTTDFDNQDLALQNEKLMQQLTELEEKFYQEQDKSQLQANLAEQLRKDLADTKTSLLQLAELESHLKALEATLLEREHYITKLESEKELLQKDFTEKFQALELAHKNYLQTKEEEKEDSQRGFAEKYQTLELAHKNYIQSKDAEWKETLAQKASEFTDKFQVLEHAHHDNFIAIDVESKHLLEEGRLSLGNKFASLETDYQEKMATLEKDYQEKLTTLERDYEETLTALQAAQAEDLAGLETEFKEQMKEAKQYFSEQYQALKLVYQESLTSKEAENEKQLAQLQSQFDEKYQAMKQDYEQRFSEKNDLIGQLQEEARISIADRVAAIEAEQQSALLIKENEVAQLREKHQEARRQFKEELHTLARLQQENFIVKDIEIEQLKDELSESKRVLALQIEELENSQKSSLAAKQNEIESVRQAALEKERVLEERIASLEQTYHQNLAAKAQLIAQLEESGQQKEKTFTSRLQEISRLSQENFLSKEAEINHLQDVIEKEDARIAALQEDLNLARFNFTQERNSLRNLEQIVQESYKKASNFEQQLNEKQLALAAQEDQLKALSQKEQSLQEELALQEEQLKTLSQKEQSLQEKLALQEELAKQSGSLKQELQSEKYARRSLQEQLDKTLALYQQSIEKIQEEARHASSAIAERSLRDFTNINANKETADNGEETGSSRWDRINSINKTVRD